VTRFPIEKNLDSLYMSFHFQTNTLSVGDTVDNTISLEVNEMDLSIQQRDTAANIRVNDVVLQNFSSTIPVSEVTTVTSRLDNIEARLAALEARLP